MAPETDHDNEARSVVVAIALTLPDEDAADLMVQHMNEGENLQPSREINARRAGVASTMTSMAVHAGNDLVSILIPHFDSNCSDLLSNATQIRVSLQISLRAFSTEYDRPCFDNDTDLAGSPALSIMRTISIDLDPQSDPRPTIDFG